MDPLIRLEKEYIANRLDRAYFLFYLVVFGFGALAGIVILIATMNLGVMIVGGVTFIACFVIAGLSVERLACLDEERDEIIRKMYSERISNAQSSDD